MPVTNETYAAIVLRVAELELINGALLNACVVALPFVEDAEDIGFKHGYLSKTQRMIREAIACAERKGGAGC